MKNKGFTLIELLAVIALLAAIMFLIYPNVLEKLQEKDSEIVEKKKQLIYTAAYNYLYDNKADYPVLDGKKYCVSIGHLSYLGLMPIDDYADVLKDDDISKNDIYIQVGNGDNVYRIVTNTTNCTDGVLEG